MSLDVDIVRDGSVCPKPPTVTPDSVTLSGPIHPTNESATFTASASNPNGTPAYHFWVALPNGTWDDRQNDSTHNTFTLQTSTTGDYVEAVKVMGQAQVAAGEWNMAQTTLPGGVFNGSTVSVHSNAMAHWPKGYGHPDRGVQRLLRRAVSVLVPVARWRVAGPGRVLAANNPHDALESNVFRQVAYSTAGQVVVSPATQTVGAHHSAAVSVTFTGEDRHGNRMANFSGMLTLSDNGAGSGISVGGV